MINYSPSDPIVNIYWRNYRNTRLKILLTFYDNIVEKGKKMKRVVIIENGISLKVKLVYVCIYENDNLKRKEE